MSTTDSAAQVTGLGDALRALVTDAPNPDKPTSLLDHIHTLAAQADELERDRDRWKAAHNSTERFRNRAERARQIALDTLDDVATDIAVEQEAGAVEKAHAVLDGIEQEAGEFPDERRYNLALDLVERLRAALYGR